MVTSASESLTTACHVPGAMWSASPAPNLTSPSSVSSLPDPLTTYATSSVSCETLVVADAVGGHQHPAPASARQVDRVDAFEGDDVDAAHSAHFPSLTIQVPSSTIC